MRRSKLSMVLVLAAGALAGGVVSSGCGENPVPVNPTYSHEIKPLVDAHCIRCHNPAITGKPDPDIPAGFNPVPPATMAIPMPGPLTIGGATSVRGDFTNYTGLKMYSAQGALVIMNMYLPYMPPPPSEPLSGWELDVFQRWLAQPLE